jgi:hypothetical protein
MLGSSQLSHSSPALETPAPEHSVCPFVLASHCRMTADLLAESVEIAIASGTGILRAVRECDDPGILENFRCFDAAARTARRCAEDLRTAVNLPEPRGAP